MPAPMTDVTALYAARIADGTLHREPAQLAVLPEFERIRAGLHALIAACPGHGRAEACPILNALSREETA